MADTLFSMLVPLIIASTAVYALYKKVDVYSALIKGVSDGLTIMLRIFPALVALLTAIYMLRASGAMEALAVLISPVLNLVGIPPETAPLIMVRPVSGSGALAVGAELINTYGADSTIGRTVAVMLGSTETTFYTIAVYFAAAGITRTRFAIPAALFADMIGFIAAAFAVRLLF